MKCKKEGMPILKMITFLHCYCVHVGSILCMKKGCDDLPISEAYRKPPRITSTYSRTMFDELCKIADEIDFGRPIFAGRFKRNRSLGSVQAFIVELAVCDETFRSNLRRYMLYGGRYWCPIISHQDIYTSRMMEPSNQFGPK